MSQDMLETLRAIDPVVLTDVVRQDQRSSTFEILDWKVERFGDKGIFNVDSLFRFSGHGSDQQGEKSWSVILKILKDPGTGLDPRHLRYWKRELLAVQSGLLSNLRGPVIAPRCYGTSESRNGGWVWMEHIIENTKPDWTIDQYIFAARQLGVFNGLYLASLPDYPWLCKGHVPGKVETGPPHHAWESPFVCEAFPSRTRERILRLWDERERFYNVLDCLPQVFSHFDFHRRNLLICQRDGHDQIVALDWAWCGYGALGADLYSLVGGSALIFEIEPEVVPEIEAATFEAYLAGLHEVGWADNSEWVRLSYNICFAMFLAAFAPALTANATTDSMNAFVSHQFGRSGAALASGWAALCELALDRADEARRLMDRLL